MTAIHLHALLLTAAIPCLAGAADAPFHYDRQQAIDLAAAHIRSEFQRHPQAAIPGVDYDHPLVVTVRAHLQRRFVFVSFTSTLAKWGEYVVFELCGNSASVVLNAAGKVIDIEVFREVVSSFGPATPLALPSVCAESEM